MYKVDDNEEEPESKNIVDDTVQQITGTGDYDEDK